MNRKHIALVFGRELLDLRRERRVITSLVLQPVVFVLLMAAPAFFLQQAESRSRTTAFTVAVEGPVDAVPGLRAALSARPLRFRTTGDAARAVIGGTAEVGLRVGAARPGAPVPL